jgi:hypothetical protein
MRAGGSACASASRSREDVFEKSKQSALHTALSWRKSSVLRDKFSKTASITAPHFRSLDKVRVKVRVRLVNILAKST